MVVVAGAGWRLRLGSVLREFVCAVARWRHQTALSANSPKKTTVVCRGHGDTTDTIN